MSFRNICLAFQHTGAELILSNPLEAMYVTRRLDGDVYWRITEPGRIDVASAPEGPWTAATYGITVELNAVGQALTHQERRNAMEQLDLALIQARDRAGLASGPNAERARNPARSGAGDAQAPSDLSGVTEGRRRAQRGATQAAEHADSETQGWSDRALWRLLAYARSGQPFMVEDVRAAAEATGLPRPPDNRAWGRIVREARDRGAIRHVGYAPNKSPNCHASPKSVWQAI